jgi:hypothetical protein
MPWSGRRSGWRGTAAARDLGSQHSRCDAHEKRAHNRTMVREDLDGMRPSIAELFTGTTSRRS